MLTAYLLLPIIFAGLALPFLVECFDWLPEWYQCGRLTVGGDIAFLLFAVAIALLFYRYEKMIVIHSSQVEKIVMRSKVASIVSILVLLFAYILDGSINIRDLAQEFSMNTLFNVAKVLVVLYFFGVFGSGKSADIVMGIIAGGFNALSGSKASMLVPILIALMVINKDKHHMFVSMLFIGLILGLTGLIPYWYFVRYADVGLSAHQTAYIYQSTGIDLYPFYIQVIVNTLEGTFGFNPVVEYLKSTNFAVGFNLTPTIVGEVMGSGIFSGLFIIICLMIFLRIGKYIFLVYFTPAIYGAWFFTFATTLQSSLLDIVFYNVYFILALMFIGVIRWSMNLLKNLRRT